jgi:predicted SprT family Zn-dependent metalloprotease
MEVAPNNNTNNMHMHDPLLAIKARHERLKTKYGYLWQSLTRDPAVIQEYQSLLLLQTTASVQSMSVEDAPLDDKKKDSITRGALLSSLDSKNGGRSQRIGSGSVNDGDNDSAIKDKLKKTSNQNDNTQIDFLTAVETRRPVQFQIGSCCDASNGCDGINCAEPIVEIVEETEMKSSKRSLSRMDVSQVRDIHQEEEEEDDDASWQSETMNDDTSSYMERHEILQDPESASLNKDVDLDLSVLNLYNDSIDEGEEADDEKVMSSRCVRDGGMNREDSQEASNIATPPQDIAREGISSGYRKTNEQTKSNLRNSSLREEEEKASNRNDDGSASISSSESSSDDEIVRFTLNETSFISAGIVIMDDDSQEEDSLDDKRKNAVVAPEKHAVRETDSAASSSDDAEWSENGSQWIVEQESDLDKNVFDSENKIIIVEDSDDISYEAFSNNDDASSESDGSEKENRMYDFESKGNTSGYVNKKDSIPDYEKWSKTQSIPKNIRPNKSQNRTNLNGNNIQGKNVNFKRNKEIITSKTFEEFNSLIFKNNLNGVKVQWSSRLIKTAGITRLKRCGKGDGATRTAMIELSTKLIDCEDRLRSTLCHEMCHAAQWLIDGVARPPHGSCFKKWASLAMRKINGMLVTTTHDYVTNTFKFAWVSQRRDTLVAFFCALASLRLTLFVLLEICQIKTYRHAPLKVVQ